MFERIKKLLFTTATKEKKTVVIEEAVEKVLKKIRDENECRLREFRENMVELDCKLTASFTANFGVSLITAKEAMRKFYEETERRERLERIMRVENREVMKMI